MPEKIKLTLAEIAARTDGTVVGDETITVNAARGLDSACEGCITFASDKKTLAALADSTASAAIIPQSAEDLPCAAVKVKNPAVAFALVSQMLAPAIPKPECTKHASAVISENCCISHTACIGAGVIIEEGATIGEGVKIYPNCYIGHNVKIADNTILYANVTVYYGCEIGKDCIIHSGAVIGADGFGFQWDGTRHLKIPQIGNVVIGNEVEIGANSTVDRGRFGTTLIKDGCKIDNLVHVAHNCQIGECSVFAGLVGISGSVEIGKGVVVGGQVGFADHIKVADGSIFYAKSGVANDIEKTGIYAGQPAKDIKSAVKEYHNMRSVGNLKSRIKELEKKLEKLENEANNSGE